MSEEEAEGQDTGAGSLGAGIDASGVGIAVALDEARAHPELKSKVEAFLDKQSVLADKQGALIDDQRHHLREQFKHLHLSVWEKQLGVLLRVATAVMGLGIAAGLAFMIWGAYQSNGVLIEPFSVPPDLAARGMTGQVVAAKLLDHLSQMQAETKTLRTAKSYANDTGQAAIKLDIPETGVSLTELDNFLREKLGHDTHITGEIVRMATGVSLTARSGLDGAESVTGSEADLDGLVRQLSEHVYRLSQPYRYGVYLVSNDRLVEALPIFKAVAETGPTALDRAYGYNQLGYLSAQIVDIDTGLRQLQQAIAVEPENVVAQGRIAEIEQNKSLPEQVIRDVEKTMTLLVNNKLGMFSGQAKEGATRAYQSAVSELLGDFQDRAESMKIFFQASRNQVALSWIAAAMARDHDLAMARTTIGDFPNSKSGTGLGYSMLYTITAKMQVDSEVQDWAGVLSEADAIGPMVQKYPGMRSYLPTTTVPLTAYAEAKLGKITDAAAHISATPADCYDCLITRARIGELQGQHPRADWWFARAIDGQKSIPFAYSYWGQALMERGDYVSAIAKLTIANQKGPHFADPLEMWGETLMLQKHPDLALAKFAEAEKYAPNWGRLHLKWGEALVYAGRPDQAKAQFARAAALDLTPAEKAELARQTPHA